MKVKSESEVAQLCPTLSDPMDSSLPGSSVYGFSRQEYWSGVPLSSPCITPRHILILLILLCWSLLICSLLMSKYSRNQFLISSNPLTLSPTHICCCHPKFKPAFLKHPKFDPTCPSHKHGTCKAFSILIGSNSSFPLKAKSLRVTFELSDEVPVNAPQSTIQEKKENYLLSLLISTVQIFSP